MKKILIPVNGGKGTKDILAACGSIVRPAEEVILLHVERLEGNSLMIDMLGEAELATLREAMEGTEHKEALDRRAEQILEHYRAKLEGIGARNVRTLVREGVPSEQILQVAAEECVDLIVLGSDGARGLARLISGSVTKDVESGARVPVLVAKNDGCQEAAPAWREAYVAR